MFNELQLERISVVIDIIDSYVRRLRRFRVLGKYLTLKNKQAREMAQWLRVLIAFPEDLSLVLNIYTRQLTATSD